MKIHVFIRCAAAFLCLPFLLFLLLIHDLMHSGILIPNDVDKLSQFRSKAFCVLVVEKDSTFQKLLDDKIERFIGDCILITVRIHTASPLSQTNKQKIEFHAFFFSPFFLTREKAIRTSTLAASSDASGTNCNCLLLVSWTLILMASLSSSFIDSEVKYIPDTV